MGLWVLLRYMYHAALEVSNANVQTVAMAAYFMQMEDVFQACQKHMMAHMDASNCVGIYYFAKQIGAEDLADQSRKYLYRHFAEVSLHEEILEVEVHQLLTLIQSDDLNVSREESILDLVLRWVNHRPDRRTEHLVELLKQVRLQLAQMFIYRGLINFAICKNQAKGKLAFSQNGRGDIPRPSSPCSKCQNSSRPNSEEKPKNGTWCDRGTEWPEGLRKCGQTLQFQADACH